MIKIIDRYILRAFFTNYFIAMMVMIGLYVTLDLFVNLDEFTSIKSDTKLQTILKITDFYGHNLFLYFSQLAGMITLMAACFTLGRFHRTNEFTALLASGTSMYRVAAPILIAGLGLNAMLFFDQEVVIPRYADKLSRRHNDIEGRNSFSVWFLPDRDNHLVSASAFQPRAKEMRGLLIMKRDAEGRMSEVIRADRAHWDDERQRWHLSNGFLMKFQREGQSMPVSDLGRPAVAEYESDLAPKELALQQASLWMSFLSLPDLDRLQQRFPTATEFIKIKHKRLTAVLVNMIMLCLGLPFFLNRERPSVIVAGSRCMAMCGTCYVFTFILQRLDLSMSPALPVWIPVILFAPVAVLLLDGIKT